MMKHMYMSVGLACLLSASIALGPPPVLVSLLDAGRAGVQAAYRGGERAVECCAACCMRVYLLDERCVPEDGEQGDARSSLAQKEE